MAGAPASFCEEHPKSAIPTASTHPILAQADASLESCFRQSGQTVDMLKLHKE